MPIYEYQARRSQQSCPECRDPFEVLQGAGEPPVKRCPACGGPVKRVLSLCRAAVAESSPEDARVGHRIKEYEKAAMWSHAAELADKHAENTKNRNLRMRALDNYKKAGYDVNTLAKHDETSND